MPNTFLNTGRTVRATSNPQQNVQQVQPNAQTVVQNNPTSTTNQANTTARQTTQTAQNNAINPITIPIQIQPTVATQNQPQTVQAQPNQTLQRSANTSTAQAGNAAPTPQTYQAQNTNNNVIDFNQIYDSYQSQYGNNQNQTSSTTGTS